MGILAAIMLPLFVGLVINLTSHEIRAWSPHVVKRLLAFAVSRIPDQNSRCRYAEEWDSVVAELPGEVTRMAAAAGCVWAAESYRRSIQFTLLLLNAKYMLFLSFINFAMLTNDPRNWMRTTWLSIVSLGYLVVSHRRRKAMERLFGQSINQFALTRPQMTRELGERAGLEYRISRGTMRIRSLSKAPH